MRETAKLGRALDRRVDATERQPWAREPGLHHVTIAMLVVDSPDVVGLMRCNKQGKRQLHVWAAGGYTEACGTVDTDSDCECAT